MQNLGQAFGDAVRKRRLQLGLSQEKLAFRCGSHRNYIGEIERGEKSPSLHIVFALAEALEIRPSALIKTTEDSKVKAPPDDRAYDSD